MRAAGLILFTAVPICAQTPEILDAARAGRTTLVEAAMAKGQAVDSRDLSGRTALMLAAGNGHASTVRLLLDNGADANARDAHGWNAYMFALLSPSGDAVHAHEAVLKLLPEPPRFRIVVNAMWEPAETSFRSCFLKPDDLTRQMRELRTDGMVIDALLRYAIASGRDLLAIVQSDAMGTSEVPNKVAREDVDATLLMTVQPEVTCGYQVDKLGLSIRADLLRPGKEPKTLSLPVGRFDSAANPRQYSPMFLEQARREIGPVYWTLVTALMEQR
jgi:hypothetical protein